MWVHVLHMNVCTHVDIYDWKHVSEPWYVISSWQQPITITESFHEVIQRYSSPSDLRPLNLRPPDQYDHFSSHWRLLHAKAPFTSKAKIRFLPKFRMKFWSERVDPAVHVELRRFSYSGWKRWKPMPNDQHDQYMYHHH